MYMNSTDNYLGLFRWWVIDFRWVAAMQIKESSVTLLVKNQCGRKQWKQDEKLSHLDFCKSSFWLSYLYSKNVAFIEEGKEIMSSLREEIRNCKVKKNEGHEGIWKILFQHDEETVEFILQENEVYGAVHHASLGKFTIKPCPKGNEECHLLIHKLP